MSHCEWKPIEEAPKYSTGRIYAWDAGELVEVVWDRRHPCDARSWCQIYHERDGDEVYSLEPQPKYYLAVTPPPED